jgi:hypothetical protein
LDELNEADEPISTKSAMCHFIFTLGPEFEAIQNNFRIGNLPSEWKTQDWPSLLVLCRDYYHSIKPQSIIQNMSSYDNEGISQSERVAQHKKVKEWFLNPTKFHREIENEQKKYSGKCIYHLSRSHTTPKCNVKKDCEKLIAEKKNTVSTSAPPTSNTGHLRNLKEDLFEDAVAEDTAMMLPETPSNDTNNDNLYYFSRMTNHYLRLVKVSPHLTATSRHSMRYPILLIAEQISICSRKGNSLKHSIQQMVKLSLVMEELNFLSKMWVQSSVRLVTIL